MTNNKKYTLKEWLNEFGSVILYENTYYEVGDILPMAQDGPNDDIIRQPFIVKRKATEEEYVNQMRQAGQNPVFHHTTRYFYEVSTD